MKGDVTTIDNFCFKTFGNIGDCQILEEETTELTSSKLIYTTNNRR